MSSRPLPPRPDLEQLKKQAKELLRAQRARDGSVCARLREHHPRFNALTDERILASPFALADAQLVIAREHGFASWPKLKTQVEEVALGLHEKVEAFLDALMDGAVGRARRWIASEPSIAEADLRVAAALGETGLVARALSRDKTWATRRDARGCDLLLYVAYSRLHEGDAARAHALVETARALLAHGADPNTARPADAHHENPLTALYGSCGPAYHPSLARVLLEAGANPDDGESLYHSSEHRDHACTQLLLDHGAATRRTNALGRMLDFEDLEGAELLIAHGADVRETLCAFGVDPRGTLLHHAVERGRSGAILALLVRQGVEIEPRRALDGRTALALAVLQGREDQEKALRELGAQDSASPVDRFLGACVRGDEADARTRLAADPTLLHSLSAREAGAIADAAERGDVAGVELMLDIGFDLHALGSLRGTALHQAALRGRARVVQLLLARGADIELHDPEYDSTPLGWALHGRATEPDYPHAPDWLGTVRSLLEHGARCDDVDILDQPPDLADLLRRHGARDPE